MAVRRIVTNIVADRIEDAKAFYADILGMAVVMDLGWIMTFAADAQTTPQVSIATEGGVGSPVPDISIEVDDFDSLSNAWWLPDAGSSTVRLPRPGVFNASMCGTRSGAWSIS